MFLEKFYSKFAVLSSDRIPAKSLAMSLVQGEDKRLQSNSTEARLDSELHLADVPMNEEFISMVGFAYVNSFSCSRRSYSQDRHIFHVAVFRGIAYLCMAEEVRAF